MPRDFLIRCELHQLDAIALLQRLRDFARPVHQRGYCGSFLPINRGNEGYVDCYLFEASEDSAYFQLELTRAGFGRFAVSELNLGEERALLVQAALTTEVLLDKFSASARYSALLEHHLHYIMNSLGNTYISEAAIYADFSTAIAGASP